MGFCPGDTGTVYMDDELRKLILESEDLWSSAYPLPSRDAMILLA